MKLVDSDVLIAHLRGVTAARDWLEAARRETGPLAISAISIAEVAFGMRSGERREVNRLLTAMRRVPLSESVAWRAAGFMRTYRRSQQGIGLGDYLMAGTADAEGLELGHPGANVGVAYANIPAGAVPTEDNTMVVAGDPPTLRAFCLRIVRTRPKSA